MRVKHKARGHTYKVIGYARIQTDVPLRDYDTVVVYQDEEAPHDEELWARRRDEFFDGRFETISDNTALFRFIAHVIVILAVGFTLFAA